MLWMKCGDEFDAVSMYRHAPHNLSQSQSALISAVYETINKVIKSSGAFNNLSIRKGHLGCKIYQPVEVTL